jgi:hypothetical protein
MKRRPEFANVPTSLRTARYDIRKGNPRLRTADDPLIWRALVVHSASTR